MVGDSSGLRQEADAAKQAFASLSQKLSGLEGRLDLASEDQKSFIEGQIESLKGSIISAAADVNRTSSEYSTAVAQEKTEELMKEVKEENERIEKHEKAEQEKELREKELAQKKEKPEVHDDSLLFLSDTFGPKAGVDPVLFTDSNAGAKQAVADTTDAKTSKKEEPALKPASGTSSTNT